jgi:hypothetical protein
MSPIKKKNNNFEIKNMCWLKTKHGGKFGNVKDSQPWAV